MPWELWCWWLGHNTICYGWCVGFPWSCQGRVSVRYLRGAVLVLWPRIALGWERMGNAAALTACNAYIAVKAFWYIPAWKCWGYGHYNPNSVWSHNRDCLSSLWWVHIFIWCTILKLNGQCVPFQHILHQSCWQLMWKILALFCASIDLTCWRICNTHGAINICETICWQGFCLGQTPHCLLHFKVNESMEYMLC